MSEDREASSGRPKAPPGKRESLLALTSGPLLWSAHFVLSYATVAVWCAKVAGRSGQLDSARVAVGIYTLFALLGIAFTFWRGYQQFSLGEASVPHDYPTAADRHRFLGFATLLLSALSFVGTAYVALAAVFIRSCA